MWSPKVFLFHCISGALKAVTLDSAYSLRLEKEVESISPGKRANFTVLEANPYRVDPAAIKDIGIWGTVFEGRLQPVLPIKEESGKCQLASACL